MGKRRPSLVLSVTRLWLMGLPFRLYYRQRILGFEPELRNMIGYQVKALLYALYDRDCFRYLHTRFWSLLRRR